MCSSDLARTVLEDITVAGWKVGFLGSADAVSAVAEDFSGVAQQHAGGYRQGMCAHCGQGADVSRQTAGTAGIGGVEAHHAGRRCCILRRVAAGIGGAGVGGGIGANGQVRGSVTLLGRSLQ